MTATHLTSAAHTRRARLTTALGPLPALLPAGEARPRNYPANTYPYRASSHFLYFTALSLPGAALWLDGDDQRLLLPTSDPLDALWHAPAVSPEALTASGLRIGNITQLPQLAAGRHVACTPPLSAADRQLFAALLAREPERLGSDQEHDGPLLEAIIGLRLQHDEAALTELRRAAEVSVLGHQRGIESTCAGLYERDVLSAMEGLFLQRGFGTAYSSIVTVHGEVLHNHEHGGLLRDGDLLLADVGAESESGYASDITRTWPVSGRFSSTQRDDLRAGAGSRSRAPSRRCAPGCAIATCTWPLRAR